MGSGAQKAVVARRVGRRKREESFILVGGIFLDLIFFELFGWWMGCIKRV